LMDVFPMGMSAPVRIDLFDDEIETLRTFDPDSQRTLEKLDRLELLPAKEFPFDAESIARFRNRWHETFNVDVRRCSVYQDVSSGIPPSGIEYYLPFFFPQLATLFDYLPDNTLVIMEQGVREAAEQYLTEVAERYDNLAHDIERPILPPADLYLRLDELGGHLNRYPQIDVATNGKHQVSYATSDVPDVQANARAKNPADALSRYLAGHGSSPVLFTAETAGRRELLFDFLNRAGIRPTEVSGFAQFLADRPAIGITTAPLDRSTVTDEFVLISESALFGHRPSSESRASRSSIDPDQIIRNLTELTIGSPVVHLQHGIGRYQGLTMLSIDGHKQEFLTLSYADEAKLYVPVTSLQLISRYSGADSELAPLHRLGSDQWEKAKRKAAERVVDVAAELLNIYARRASNKSIAFDQPGDDYARFAQQFPFDVTPDQQRAIDEVIADLCAEQSTDRLICGDVGFGKTEVAMRAAFLAVQNGKQVAVLVPTTLLAQQHTESFQDRFASWPVQIDCLSRFRNEAEVADVRARMISGRADVVIGTHKLLSEGFRFKDLGLVIIDEEHRFGVRQKERLRSLRANVDILALTATPIPRTLNMAVSGIRDLSIIATPPAKRLSIKTFVQQKRNHIIKEAISRELMRGGQVFYLHNEVRDIEQVAAEVAEMLPEIRIGIAHGQMPKRTLEGVMGDFYHRQINVLVCTTIIETGIDVPNANTMIIERADKFGLAQLHQLRGRVGRSHRQAYAYLLTPHSKAMTGDAVKRLEAIEAAGELGVGFTLATHDLEIRGAGELLGDDQSGQIESIGFTLYMELLDRAVSAIRAGQTPNMDRPLEQVTREVNLHGGVLIPDDYLPDVHTRLIMYKRISNATSQPQLDDLQVEMIDRFGLLPDPLKALFSVTALKLRIQVLGIEKLDIGEERGKIEFGSSTSVDPIAVVKLVQNQPATYQLDGATTLRTSRRLKDFHARLIFAEGLLDILTVDQAMVANG
ncbi:MAG: transcription-repair coupling factor, partial [Proteobacteria bacterium]|nr:transcription-repair coupling factor [Pseudomonadota bacterium]